MVIVRCIKTPKEGEILCVVQFSLISVWSVCNDEVVE